MKVRIASEVDGLMAVDFEDTAVSIVNALRRTIYRLRVVGIDKVAIQTNTSLMSNEILENRLRSIPIHCTELEPATLTVQVANTGTAVLTVTTADFVLTPSKPWYPAETMEVMGTTYSMPHELLLLNEGEKIDLTATFGLVNSDGVNVQASDCYFRAVKDDTAVEDAWRKSGMSSPVEEHDFKVLTANRYVRPDCFRFMLRTIGVHPNTALLKMACQQLIGDLQQLDVTASEFDGMEHGVDLTLASPDHVTIGVLLADFLFRHKDEFDLAFVAFLKKHPDDVTGIVRLSTLRKDVWREAVPRLVDVFETLGKLFA
jgi:hypothetical protein